MSRAESQPLPALFEALPPGGALWLGGLGTSMSPFLRSGDSVHATRCSAEALSLGDIALIRRVDGGLAAHIVVEKRPVKTARLGGALDRPGARVLGRVTEVRARGMTVPLHPLVRWSLLALHKGMTRARGSRIAVTSVRSARALLSAPFTTPLRRRLLGPLEVRLLGPEDERALLIYVSESTRQDIASLQQRFRTRWCKGEGFAVGAFDSSGKLRALCWVDEYRVEGLDVPGIWVRTVFVQRIARRLGLASRMLDLLLEESGRRGLTELFADIEETNFASLSLFGGKGFQQGPDAIERQFNALIRTRGLHIPRRVLRHVC